MRERFLFNREMRLRLTSAAILAPVALASIFFGEVSFLLFVLAGAALVLYEYLRMIGARHLYHLHLAGWALLAVDAVATQTMPPVFAAGVAVLGAIVLGLAAWRDRSDIAVRWVVAGALYIGLAVVALGALRKGEEGLGIVVFVFIIGWASDTAAFFAGRKLGGPKLWPAVSPSKTWSGAAGGLVAGIALGTGVAWWLGVPPSLASALVAALVAVTAQFGDLLESAAKRHFMIKDTGTLIPGHGGVMDRVDGIVASALAAALAGGLVASDAPARGLLSLMAGG